MKVLTVHPAFDMIQTYPVIASAELPSKLDPNILKHSASNTCGNKIDCLSAAQVVRLGVAHCPEGHMVFPRMRVIENLKMGAFFAQKRYERRFAVCLLPVSHAQ